jgi:glycosyltransferase involved in cell wall biosynthesis
VTEATRSELVSDRLVEHEKLSVIFNGVDSICSAQPDVVADLAASELLGPRREGGIDILHVASTAPRKRVDVALRVLSMIRDRYPAARLIRVGGSLTPALRNLVRELAIEEAVVELPCLSREMLAAVYRRCDIVILPSESEGFGLPVIEALACGTPVVCSDLPVLREVASSAATFCPLSDITAWSEALEALSLERETSPAKWQTRRELGLRQAARFSWQTNAGQTAAVYREVIEGRRELPGHADETVSQGL